MSIIQTTSKASLSKMNALYDRLFSDENEQIKSSLMQKFTRYCLSKMNLLYYTTYISKITSSPIQQTTKRFLFEATKEDIESVELKNNKAEDNIEIILHLIEGGQKDWKPMPGNLYCPFIEGLLFLVNLNIDDCSNNVLTETVLELTDIYDNTASWKIESANLSRSITFKCDEHNEKFDIYNCQSFSNKNIEWKMVGLKNR